jgi:hypothetical protein
MTGAKAGSPKASKPVRSLSSHPFIPASTAPHPFSCLHLSLRPACLTYNSNLLFALSQHILLNIIIPPGLSLTLVAQSYRRRTDTKFDQPYDDEHHHQNYSLQISLPTISLTDPVTTTQTLEITSTFRSSITLIACRSHLAVQANTCFFVNSTRSKAANFIKPSISGDVDTTTTTI